MPGFFVFHSRSDKIGKLDLVGVKFHSRVVHVELLDLLDARQLMIDKNLQINISQQIQVNLVAVVSYGHDKRTALIKKVDLLRQ